MTVASFQSRVAAFAVMVRLLSPPILFYFLFQVGQVFLYFQWWVMIRLFLQLTQERYK